jgi:hypothetical protein
MTQSVESTQPILPDDIYPKDWPFPIIPLCLLIIPFHEKAHNNLKECHYLFTNEGVIECKANILKSREESKVKYDEVCNRGFNDQICLGTRCMAP